MNEIIHVRFSASCKVRRILDEMVASYSDQMTESKVAYTLFSPDGSTWGELRGILDCSPIKTFIKPSNIRQSRSESNAPVFSSDITAQIVFEGSDLPISWGWEESRPSTLLKNFTSIVSDNVVRPKSFHSKHLICSPDFWCSYTSTSLFCLK